MIGIIKGWLAPYLLYLKVAGIVLLMAGAWYARGVLEQARAAKAQQEAINNHLAAEGKSYAVGLNLETGLNDYKFKSLELDRKVLNATSHDTSSRFDADSVQRTAERIAAGAAARKRSNSVR